MRFAKAHAYGNDFLYVTAADVAGAAERDLVALARAMCDRHAGIGADGLIIFDTGSAFDTGSGTATGATSPGRVSMRLLNADGSRAEVSGNGVRALGALLLDADPRADATLVVETVAGAKRLVRTGREGARQFFRASMGAPQGVAEIRIEVPPVDDVPGVSKVDGGAGAETVAAVVLDMGNPQCVLLGPLPDDARFARLGAALERHPRFPQGTNVEFAEVETPARVRIRIWERGVGPTTSSGTGSCAALVAAAAFGGADRDAEVVAPGGPQRVEWTADGVFLTGWADVICDGDWRLPFLRTAV